MNVMNVNLVLVVRLHQKRNCKFGNPQSRPTSFDLDVIIPEYKRPSGFFGVRAGACIRQNTVFHENGPKISDTCL